MADGHLGYGVPIGGVIAAEDRISPTAVGFDIACGNKAVRLDIPGNEVRSNIARIMDDIWKTLSFGVGRKNPERNDDSPRSSWMRMRAGIPKRRSLFATKPTRNWGRSAAAITMSIAAGAKDGMMVDPVFLDAKSDLGQQYIHADVGVPQGSDACFSGPAGLRRRNDGRAVGDPGGSGFGGVAGCSLQHGPRGGTRPGAQAGRRA